jgi:hypothetical protein
MSFMKCEDWVISGCALSRRMSSFAMIIGVRTTAQGEAKLLDSAFFDFEQKSRGDRGTGAGKAPERQTEAPNNPNPSRSGQIDLFGSTLSRIPNSRVDNEQTNCEKGRGNKRQLGKEELHLGVASMLFKEDFLNQELEG